MTARMSMSAPSRPAHTRCSLFLKMNCLAHSSISIINNACWINLKTIDTRLSSPQGSLMQDMVTRTHSAPALEWAPASLHPFSSLGPLLTFNHNCILQCLIATSKFGEASGLETGHAFTHASSPSYTEENTSFNFWRNSHHKVSIK